MMLSLACSPAAFAQDEAETTGKANAKNANEKFINENFEEALEDYLVLLAKEPNNQKYIYRVGVCYLNSNINKSKAVTYFEKLSTTADNMEPETMYLLGRAYHFSYRFDEAIKAYNKYRTEKKAKPENLKDAEREIQYCYNAKELMKYPLNVTFDNLGKNINSIYADYYPFAPVNEGFVAFNSKRLEGKGLKNPDGTYPSGIYIAKVTNGTFEKARPVNAPINSAGRAQEVIGLTNSGTTMLLYNINQKGIGDIYITNQDKNGSFSKPQLIDENVNSKGHEIAAAISADGNTLYFASDRAGGFGGTDLYVSKKLPTGKFSPATNLGNEINSAFDEDFPNLSPDGKRLYFSSKGHTSMGGYDIFTADWDDATQKYSGVKNLGYPVNTPEDNMNFRVSETGKYGYMAALREGGLGDLDIYRVTFNEIESKYTVIKGRVADADTTKKVDYSGVSITVSNDKGDVFGNYLPNPNTGVYVIIVPPGKYEIAVDAAGYKSVSEKFDVYDKSSFRTEIEKDFVLK